ncbi:hypothetical protein, partial [Desulfofundulus sp.]|uniref:hypothetical protein n=1 Tax=Desulfofundulus sp. TaxID=2282750 RepID=UPI003C76558B
VPVHYETYFSCSEPGVEVVLDPSAGFIDGRGDSREGDMWLQVGSVLENHNYSFEVGLTFRQWNAVE